MSHTPTPWAFSDTDYVDRDGVKLRLIEIVDQTEHPAHFRLFEIQNVEESKAVAIGGCGPASHDNARRIVACVNRLESFTTEQIEDLGYDLFADVRPRYEDAIREQRRILEQRDRAERALTRAGWTYTEGAEEWQPPLGPSARPLIAKIDQLTGQRDQLLAALEKLQCFKLGMVADGIVNKAIKAAKGE